MLKGHTKIELTDVNTGKVEVREHDNLVTNAIAENLTFASKILGVDSVNSKFLPLNSLGMGGILLFKNKLIEGATNIAIPSVVDNTITGYASNDAYNSTDLKRGSRNGSESKKTTNGYKYVWDFSTSQANGVISSVALTSSKTGANPYAYSSKGYFDSATVTSYERYMMNFDFDTNIFTNIYVYGNRGISVRKKRLPIDKIRINSQLLELENVGDPIRYDYSDSEIIFNEESRVLDSNDEYFYIAYCYDVDLSVCRIKKTDYSIDVDFGLKNLSLEKPVQITYASKNAVVMNGSLYYFNETKVHIIGLEDVHIRHVINTGIFMSGSVAILGNSIINNGYIYFINVNGEDEIIPRPISSSGITGNYAASNIIAFENGIVFETHSSNGTDYYLSIGSTLDYLATINNLDTPIEKTSAQTMKITYTLTEV